MGRDYGLRGRRGGGGVPFLLRRGLLIVPFLVLGGCDIDSLLDVEDPDTVTPGDIEGESDLTAVHGSVLAEFSVAFGGFPTDGLSEDGQVELSGLLTDELIHTGTFDTRQSVDRRVAAKENGTIGETYLRLHRARANAAFAADFFEEFGADTERHAEVQSFEGLTQIIFGENFCSGVPFSRVAPGDVLEYGEPQTTTQVFEAAVESFEAAITVAQAAGSADQEYFARVGLGRALLNLGRFAEAAAAVASVPTDFDYRLAYSENTARQNNGVWVYNNSAGIYSVADNEGGNGLPFRSRGDVEGSIRDPRIPVEHVGLAQLGTARPEEHWAQLKFPTRASSITIASGVEARLIEAEAALNAGPAGLDDFESIHDEIRGGVGLPSLADQYGDLSAMTQDERVDVHFAERAYWLYLTSHRLGDLRRLLWDYGRAADEVFPSGDRFGSDTNFPIYLDEENNPNVVLEGNELCLTRDDEAGRDG